ncbi:MAG TPA: PIN domain-containing protein [Candidatus Aphodovivens avistercoris]|nr:PIN domain-containing protein [Candidatus Aphodovivens avistercoris]
MNLLLDTNVLIDYLGRKPPHFASAQRVVAAGFFGDAKLWVSALSLKDAFYVLGHYLDSQRVQKAMLAACEVVTPVGLSGEDSLRAARLGWDDYEDCLIALAADKAKADYLITRDLKSFARSPVPALSPEAWLSLMEREKGLVYDEISLVE